MGGIAPQIQSGNQTRSAYRTKPAGTPDARSAFNKKCCGQTGGCAMKHFIFFILLCLTLSSQAADTPVTTLDQLLAKVRAEHEKERKLNAEREAEFVREKARQQQLLDKARASYYSAQSKNNPA